MLLNTVLVSSFGGANNSEKLRAAMTFASQQTYKPALLVEPGMSFDTGVTPFELYDGFKMIGTGGETEFSHGIRIHVYCTGGTGVFALKSGFNAMTTGILFKDIGFEGSVNTIFSRIHQRSVIGERYWPILK